MSADDAPITGAAGGRGDANEQVPACFIESIEAAKESAAREQKVHPTDFSCRDLLHRSGVALSPNQIIETMNLRSGSGTAPLDRLEANDYITRVPNLSNQSGVMLGYLAQPFDSSANALDRGSLAATFIGNAFDQNAAFLGGVLHDLKMFGNIHDELRSISLAVLSMSALMSTEAFASDCVNRRSA